jgi:acetylglutamate kinase/acetylglutamate/LysW-gamma-L-alpha-aminoadipate kinase
LIDHPPLVVKIGGSTLDRLGDSWWDDLAEMAYRRPLICLHGWSPQLAAHQRAHARHTEFIVDQYGHRSRFTDAQVLDDIRQVAGSLRARIAQQLERRCLRVGLCTGEQDRLLTAEYRPIMWWRNGHLVRLLNLVGPVHHVAADLLFERLRSLDALVVSPLAYEPRHGVVNTDGDRAAARVAAAVGAQHLLLITDVPNIIAGGVPLTRLQRSEVNEILQSASGGMRKKLRAAGEALDAGVTRVHVGSARVSSLLRGEGTAILP